MVSHNECPSGPLRLEAAALEKLFLLQGPSLGLWRAAEIAALRRIPYYRPTLDLGCGDGLVTSMVLPEVDVGVDPDHVALGKACRSGIYLLLEKTRLEDSALPDRSFATVVSNSVLEHIPALDPVLDRTRRLLCPGGRLIFTVPTEHFSKCLAVTLPQYAELRNRQLNHLNLWPEWKWRAKMREHGFQILNVSPYLTPRLVKAWDALELLQQGCLFRRRLFGLVWRKLPRNWIRQLARRVAQLDFSSPAPGAGRLVVAVLRR